LGTIITVEEREQAYAMPQGAELDQPAEGTSISEFA
jgi:hypothetical protein